MRSIVLIAHNLRSCHNVGSLLRTAEGLGVSRVYLSGYTPYPAQSHDVRLPHLAAKINKQIQKTALGAETLIDCTGGVDIFETIQALKSQGYFIAALEQTDAAVPLSSWKAPAKVAIIVGRETMGIEADVLEACDQTLVIPMAGQKESFNVVQAAAMALYHLAFHAG